MRESMVKISLTAFQASRSGDNAQDHCKKLVESHMGNMPEAIFQDQQVQLPYSGPQSDDGDLPYQEIRGPGLQGSRPAAAYSYKLLPLQPLMDSDWSRRSYPIMLQMNQDTEAPSHGQYAFKRRMFPSFPTPLDPPYVVCQHCLQLLVLPVALPPLTKNTQKLRCSGCRCISVFSAEPTVSRSATIGDRPGVTDENDENDSRDFCTGQPRQYGFPMQEVASSVGRDYPVQHASEVMHASPFAVSAFEGTGVGRSSFHTEVSISPLKPVPLPSPPSYVPSGASTSASIYGTAPIKGKDIPHSVRRSFEKPIPGQGQEAQQGPGNVSSLDASSEGESDSTGDGLTLGTFAVHPLSDEFPGSSDDFEGTSAYPPSSMKDQEGVKARNKVVNIIKGIKDFTKTGPGKIYRRQVYVNSRAIPDPLVGKAENYAGPIHPGQYWYDVHAGFWGVMGGPCKGIIPPFIEELNYPLPRDCSGGKTGVVVNGRELHPKDLEILSRRGLPTAPGMSYRVEIDGRVIDVDSGQELKSLGSLAPSVEKRGRGHGMVMK